MKNNYICGGAKYKFSNHTIALPISINNLPDKIQIGNENLIVKSSFHISLVCIGKIFDKYKITIDDFEKNIIDDFCEFTKNTNIDFIKYTDFRFVTEEEKRSLIVMCDVLNLDSFFKSINKKYNLNMETQPTHITLYTLQKDVGIFITNSEDIKNMTTAIEVPKNIPNMINLVS